MSRCQRGNRWERYWDNWFSVRAFAAGARQRSGARRPSTSLHQRHLRSELLEDRRLLAITVDTLVDEADGSIDDGDVSLRDAIALAPAGETIDFSVTGTILLELGELPINKDLTIAGPGASALTIDASGNDPTPRSRLTDGDDLNDGDGSRVFNVDDGALDNNVNVHIRGLTLTGGDVDGDGGAILSDENLTVTETRIAGNIAARLSSSGRGGGIYARIRGGAITISHSTISNNSATDGGGGIYTSTSGSNAITTMDDLTVTSNFSNTTSGGGIRADTLGFGTVTTISNSSVTGNSSATNGGGIEVGSTFSGVTTISNTVVSRNSGGGVRTGALEHGEVTITDSLITQNANESSGGGISSFGPLTVTHSTITGNLAVGTSANGGGIDGFKDITVAYSVISGNATSGRGGGIRLTGGGTITHSLVTGNTARYGGGAAISDGAERETFISHSTFSGNSADVSGGGISGFLFIAPTAIENTTISGNSAGRDGGGISASIQSNELFSSSLAIRHSTIVDNVAGTAASEQGSGGGILTTGNTPTDLSHTIVAGNRLDDGTDSDIVGTLAAGSAYNLVGVDNGAIGISNSTAGNQVGTDATPLDPLLGPLADNGGPTLPGGNTLLTHAVLTGSPALDAGDPSFVPPPHTDERGIMRLLDGDGDTVAVIDIGAVEYRPPGLPGDGNLDGEVNTDDYLIWAEHYGEDPALQPPIAPENGDYNDDGVIDGLDYIIWASNYGASTAVSTSQQRAAQDAALEAEDASSVPAATAWDDDAIIIESKIDQYAIHRAFDAVFDDLAVKKNARHRRR